MDLWSICISTTQNARSAAMTSAPLVPITATTVKHNTNATNAALSGMNKGNKTMSESIELQSIIDAIAQQAFNSWKGEIGKEREESVRNVIANFLPNWSEKLGFTQLEILKSIEKNRRVNSINHYQEHQFPRLDHVTVYESIEDFKAMHKGQGFRCPSCSQVSNNPQKCDHDLAKCTWKSYGFFKCMGKGYRFVVKETFLEDGRIYEIFMPVALEQAA